MPATVTKEMETTVTIDRTSPSAPSGDFEVVFMYTGLTTNEDILKHADIPKYGTPAVRHEYIFYARRFRVEIIRDDLSISAGSGRVYVGYVINSHIAVFEPKFVRWEMTYKKVDYPFPSYVLNSDWGPNFGAGPGQPKEKEYFRWDQVGDTIPVEYIGLTVTVNRLHNGLSERIGILKDMAQVHKQVGRMHVIEVFGSTRWVMQPPQIRQAEIYRVEITYTWLHDPGNGTIALPESVPIADRERLFFPQVARPSWHRYVVIGQRTLNGRESLPTIHVADMYPETINGQPNPYYEPSGYRNLPGRPF